MLKEYSKEMGYKGVLSSVFNMSLGFIPVILVIFLAQFIHIDLSIYLSTAFGFFYSFRMLRCKGVRVPNFLLYITTLILSVYAIITFFGLPGSGDSFPVILEISVLLPAFIFYLFRNYFIRFFRRDRKISGRKLAIQGIESAVVSARLSLLLGIVHLSILGMYFLFVEPRNPLVVWILCQLGPMLVFLLSIVINQVGIHFFNKVMSRIEYIPIVNEKGNVIGRTSTQEAANYKNSFTNPVIRIALTAHGMLFLSERQDTLIDTGKIDTPLESFLLFNETLEEGANRMLKEAFSNGSGYSGPKFSIVYPFNNELTSRLIYLFVVDIKDDIILCDEKFESGKLWTLQQIKLNLGKNYFSQFLEYEFEHLNTVIYTREKYKES